MGIKVAAIVILVVLALFVVISASIYIVLRIRKARRKHHEAEDEEEDEGDPELHQAIVDKTPLGTQGGRVMDREEDQSLLVCKLAAESQKFDQEFLWKKYNKSKAEAKTGESCNPDHHHGVVKVEFYHQSYSQVFRVKIINARGLKSHDPDNELSTRVKVLLITPLKTRQIPRKTRVVEKSNNPDYDEVLEIKLTRKTTRDSTVEISAWSIDDFFKESLIGGFKIKLADYDVTQRNIIERELQIEFEEHENPGYILVSLCYNKEDDKLTVIAMRGKLLKCAAHEDTLLQETLNPYMKMYLFISRKIIKKEKTDTMNDQINPVFNSVMDFYVPLSTLDQTNIVFVVMHKDVRTDSKENIGRIVIGANATGKCLNHWNRTIAAQGKPIAQWHQLWY